jgi:uncharacterized membrane protein YbhN (UPF0104 family)
VSDEERRGAAPATDGDERVPGAGEPPTRPPAAAEADERERVTAQLSAAPRATADATVPAAAGATGTGAPQGPDDAQSDDEMPRVQITRRQAVASIAFVLSVVAFLYFVLPKISGPHGLGEAWHNIENGDAWWIGLAVVFELCSFGGYIALFRAVFVRDYERIGWGESYEITMAGLAASRLFATAGAGGLALTAWAVGRSGMPPRVVACRMVAFIVLLYLVYDFALILCGIGLGTGLLPGGGSFALTIVPAIAAAALLGLAGAVAFLPRDFERLAQRGAQGSGRLARMLAGVASVPATAASGVRTAIDLIRSNDPFLLGAPAWWGFDICVLWASFHAFGTAPPFAVIVMSYFIGMLGNLLPLPGGVGGVDGGMIGAFAAFGVTPFSLVVVSVLTYRAIAFWLPTIPGGIAYLQLRRTVARWRGELTEEGEAADAVASRAAHA